MPQRIHLQLTNGERNQKFGSCMSYEAITTSIAPLARLGSKQYEITNHLGNVLATINDTWLPDNTTYPGNKVKAPVVLTWQVYYPFGMTMPGRNFNLNTNVYRYGFNGKESDDEVKGEGNSYDFGARIYDSRLGRWCSVDPKAIEFPTFSSYISMGNNPILNIDPDGRVFYNFDADGNYRGKTHDNWFHNLFFKQGRLLNTDGSVTRQFRFADRKEDTKNIENGNITKLVVVSESDLTTLISRGGGFDHENKTENLSLDKRFDYDYLLAEGPAGGKLDFAYTQLPEMYPGDAAEAPLENEESTCHSLFLPPAVPGHGEYAHNQMNFGNYLFGLAGQAMGYLLGELKAGAHIRAYTQDGADGYPSQLDSPDDQFSIEQGYTYGQANDFEDKEYGATLGTMDDF